MKGKKPKDEDKKILRAKADLKKAQLSYLVLNNYDTWRRYKEALKNVSFLMGNS